MPEEESRPYIKRALELGINFFDTADAYSSGLSEQILGRAIKDFADREDVVLATKVCVNLKFLTNRFLFLTAINRIEVD